MDFLVFDLETQRSALEVGGWDHIEEMRMSVGVVWDSAKARFFTYYEDQVEALIQHLQSGALVVGYNHLGFDYKVLAGYRPPEERPGFLTRFEALPNLDLLLAIRDVLGRKIKLEDVARPTLQVGKSADGLQALEWFKDYLAGDEAKLQMIADYCKQDVAVTRDLYLHGLEQQRIQYLDKDFGIRKLAVDWSNKPLARALPETSEQLSFF